MKGFCSRCEFDQLQLLELGNTVHKQRHLRGELHGDLLIRHDRILDHIVQDARYDRFLVKLEIRKNDPDAERAYSAAVRNLRECRSVLDSITEEQQACFLWTAGAAMQPTGSAESI